MCVEGSKLSCLLSFSELLGSMVWCLSLVLAHSQPFLFQIFLLPCSLFSPSSIIELHCSSQPLRRPQWPLPPSFVFLCSPLLHCARVGDLCDKWHASRSCVMSCLRLGYKRLGLPSWVLSCFLLSLRSLALGKQTAMLWTALGRSPRGEKLRPPVKNQWGAKARPHGWVPIKPWGGCNPRQQNGPTLWETLNQSHPVQLLPDSWLLRTMWNNKCLF